MTVASIQGGIVLFDIGFKYNVYDKILNRAMQQTHTTPKYSKHVKHSQYICVVDLLPAVCRVSGKTRIAYISKPLHPVQIA